MKKIFIQGFYGANNLGDDFILYSLLDSINKVGEYDVKVLCYDNTYKTLFEKYPKLNITAFIAGKHTFWEKIKVVLNSDAWIIGGGGLFPKESIKVSFLLLVKIFLARLFSTKLAIYGVEYNSFNKPVYCIIWKTIFSLCDIIIVRNRDSMKKIHNLQIQKAEYGSDITFSLETEIEKYDNTDLLKKLKLQKKQYIIWALAMPWSDKEMEEEHFQLRYQKLKNMFVKTINQKHEYVHIFLPFFYDSDIKFIQDIEKNLSVDKIICDKNIKMNLEEKRYIFKYAKMAVCMRFHSVIFSIYNNTPFCAISYSPKTSNILTEEEMTENMVEFGIRNSEFFFREFDFDEDKFNKIMSNVLESGENGLDLKRKKMIWSAQVNEKKFINWLKQV